MPTPANKSGKSGKSDKFESKMDSAYKRAGKPRFNPESGTSSSAPEWKVGEATVSRLGNRKIMVATTSDGKSAGVKVTRNRDVKKAAQQVAKTAVTGKPATRKNRVGRG